MHICFLNMPCEYYSPTTGGAVSTIIMECAREILKAGHSVTILTIPADDTYAIGDVSTVTVKTRSDLNIVQRGLSKLIGKANGFDWPYFEHYLQSARKSLRRLRPDALIVFNDLVSPAYLGPELAGCRVMVWLQNEWRTRNRRLSAAIGSTYRFLTCSTYIRDWTSREHGIPLGKFVVAPSGVDLTAFFPRPDYLQANGPVRALFIGRIDPNKGPDIAVDAVHRVNAEGADVKLTVAGGLWFYGHGREMENPFFRELHAKMQAADATYLGHVSRHDVPAVVRQHDVAFVLSRANEPFGLVVLECMASGLAVISSDRGGLPEATGGAAQLVDPDDFEQVVASLKALVSQPELLRDRKQAAVRRAASATWESCARVVIRAVAGETEER